MANLNTLYAKILILGDERYLKKSANTYFFSPENDITRRYYLPKNCIIKEIELQFHQKLSVDSHIQLYIGNLEVDEYAHSQISIKQINESDIIFIYPDDFELAVNVNPMAGFFESKHFIGILSNKKLNPTSDFRLKLTYTLI
jgi:hypothetical protein